MEEEKDSKDISLLEKNDIAQLMDEDISKTTDVDLNSNEKKENDAIDKNDSVSQIKEEVITPSTVDEHEKTASTKDDDEDGEEHPPLPTRKKPEETESKENPILQELKDAFPNLEEKYIKAVIIASEGALDPAFNALLFLSDPESGKDIELPTQPVRKTPVEPVRRHQTQLEQDELLARQLDEQFNNSHSRHRRHRDDTSRGTHEQRLRDRQRRRQTPLSPDERREYYGDAEEDEDSWSQFVEKDLPELTDRAGRSLQDTANKVSNWISDAYKRNFASGNDENFNQYNHQDLQEEWEPEIADLSQSGKDSRPQQPERSRFNSFGAQVGEDSLESHGITLHNEDGHEDDEDVPPQLPTRTKSGESTGKVVAETTYIDTPDTETKKKWQPLPPEPLDTTPTKINAVSSKKKNPDEDEFLINSDDEM